MKPLEFKAPRAFAVTGEERGFPGIRDTRFEAGETVKFVPWTDGGEGCDWYLQGKNNGPSCKEKFVPALHARLIALLEPPTPPVSIEQAAKLRFSYLADELD